MKENYNNKTKLRSAWLALVLLMITALPITAQTAGEKFQVGQLYYEVVDATNHTVKVTYANTDATKPEARQQELIDETTNIPDQWKGYSGTLKTNAVDKNGKKKLKQWKTNLRMNWLLDRFTPLLFQIRSTIMARTGQSQPSAPMHSSMKEESEK